MTQSTTVTSGTNLAEVSGSWELDPAHSRLGFAVRHAMVATVHGSFTKTEGTFELDGSDPSKSTAKVSAEIASVDTGNETRDNHLRSGDFFDAEKWATMSFVSSKIVPVDEESFTITGDLTIRDQTHPIDFAISFTGSAKDPMGNIRAGFEGSTTINRKDWGLTWNAPIEAGGVLVSDKVRLEIDLSLIKK